MKLKLRAEDFVVRERYDLSAVGTEGRHAIYVVEKKERSTFEAAIRLAAAAGVPTDSVRFAGLKDRRAVTTQVMSVEGGIPVALDEEGLRAALVGFSREPARGERLEGNEFEITVRDLDEAEIARLDRGFEEISESGLPSYFDDQRFGAARMGKGFPARELVRGDAAEALRLLVAERPELAEAWGKWERCLSLARGWHEQAVFRHLVRRPTDARGALRLVPRRERLMQLFAYQSLLWNRALASLVRARVASRVSIAAELGALPAWRQLDAGELSRFESTELPLPSSESAPADPDVRAALDGALAEDGLRVADLRIGGLRGFEFREERRPCVLRPDSLEIEGPVPDADHPGRLALLVRLSLRKGAYATLVLKRAAALPETPG